jgi:hypothetical protein
MSSNPERRHRPQSVLASVLAAAGLILTVAGCSHITPLGPDAAAPLPTPHHLRSPFVLQALRAQAPSPAGVCLAGYATLPGDNSGQCYRKFGTPVRITSAAISAVSLLPGSGPATYGFTVTLPTDDVPGLTAVTTTAHEAHGSLAITVAGRTWALPFVAQPFTSPRFQVPLPRKQALQLQRLLVPSG